MAIISSFPGKNKPKLQDKTATPTTAQQTVTADSQYDGIGSVTINRPVMAASSYYGIYANDTKTVSTDGKLLHVMIAKKEFETKRMTNADDMVLVYLRLYSTDTAETGDISELFVSVEGSVTSGTACGTVIYAEYYNYGSQSTQSVAHVYDLYGGTITASGDCYDLPIQCSNSNIQFSTEASYQVMVISFVR